VLLGGFACAREGALLDALEAVVSAAPFRRMVTPGGREMSVMTTSCGAAGWVSDARGYRYAARDPESGAAWPAMPDVFAELARDAAAAGGHADFAPDACLVNRYVPGAKMSPHRDVDEKDFSAPIVSVSLGLSATFLFGGAARGDKARRFLLAHGDVAVWGGPSRLFFHGILPLKPGHHPLLGAVRVNLTFRKAL